MNFATDLVDVLGLLALLASAAVVFATIAQWLTGKRRNQVRLGVEMLVFASVAYLAVDPVTRWVEMTGYRADAAGLTATLWWLSLAYLIDAAITKFLWLGRMAVRGETTVPKLLTGFVTVLIYAAAIMAVMHFVYGEPITAIAATSGAFAFVIGYSAQSTLGELFAGISVNASRSIKKGDYIDIDGVYGAVHDVDWRSVTVFEFTSKTLVVFPNSHIASKPFRNYSLPDHSSRVDTTITIEFSAPPDLVVRAILEGFEQSQLVSRDPPPEVRVNGTNQFGMEYRVLWFIDHNDDWFPAQREAMYAIWASLKKHGIQPGLNHYLAGAGSRFDDDAWYARNFESAADRVQALADCDVLSALAPDEIGELAGQAERLDFAPPQPISRRGSMSRDLYVVVTGRVGVELEYQPGETFIAMEMGPGECFGVTNFLNGAEKKSTVQSAAYGAVLKLPLSLLAPYLDSHPEMQGAIAALAGDREAEFERRRKAHGVVVVRRAREDQKRHIHGTLSLRLGGLFKSGFGGHDRPPSKKRIVEASMAAAADGVIETSERDEVVRTFEDLELGHFMDFDKAIAKFDAYCEILINEGDGGVPKVMDELRPLAKNRSSAEIVLDICISISAADGEVEPPEEKRIEEIRAALDLSA